MNSRDRVLAALKGEAVDRPPVISVCQHATYEQMDELGAAWPEAHARGDKMAALAMGGFTMLGLDAVRVPFCQTHEAEALGAKIKDAGRTGVPSVEVHPYKIGDQPQFPDDFLERGRIPQLLQAVRILKENIGDQVIIIGGIVGPYTVATNLVGIDDMLRTSFKKPEKVVPFLELAEKAGTVLANALVEAGADVICVEDMMTSLDLVSPKIYRSLAAPYEKKQFSGINAPTIIHICGKLDAIMTDIAETGPSAISIEPVVDVKLALEEFSKKGIKMPLIGGVDPVRTLFSGTPEEVRREVEKALEDGFSMISPGCSVAPASPLENLLAIVDTVKEKK
ncbi:methylcobalamin:coenzyme M methyltransferase [Desulfocucumis palustris]|uniref:Methylcobalamin:coenzyme M methyltransferase n=1 Tax=Desulfocucumis palustris TaxID=1898651 RepID=A0A2L2X8B0_9FIRM|nr:MtaA/CmuA family methyltransferase [Desulfocucumis palustris]GBF32338.1 methylcobalamin:coenzyme M methyltransferase [Desulfocucumis palustris]